MKKYVFLFTSVILLCLTAQLYAADGDLRAVHSWLRIAWNIQHEYTTGRVFRYQEDFVDRMLIELKNAREPQGEDRAFYNAWVQDRETGLFIDLGPLEKTRDNFYEWELRRGTDDTEGYNYLVITFEANDGDNTRGVHVYEGEIFDTTKEYVDDLKARELAERQPVIDRIKEIIGTVSDKERADIREKLFWFRQKTINSDRDNEYKLQVFSILDSASDALKR